MAYQCPPSEAQDPSPSAVDVAPGKKVKQRVPQRNVDELWDKFTTKFPGKIYSILPSNVYAKTKAAQSPVGLVHGRATRKSYDEAVADCRAAVDSIARECRRVNLKYRDPHFDIEFDLKRNRRDCLKALDGSGSDLTPKSVKRVPVGIHLPANSIPCMKVTACRAAETKTAPLHEIEAGCSQ